MLHPRKTDRRIFFSYDLLTDLTPKSQSVQFFSQEWFSKIDPRVQDYHDE